MMEWKEVVLGDILNFKRGHDLPHSEMQPGSIPVAGSNGIIGYHNVATNIRPIITIGRSGNVGKPYYYECAWAHNTTLYIDDFKGNDPKYLYYLCQTMPFAKHSGGSAVPTLNRNHLHPLRVKVVTDEEDQKKIAAILSSLDAKIETNNKINAKLEEMAQALFKSWFVDFEPFKDGDFIDSELGRIPKGWRVGCLNEILSLIKQPTKAGDRKDLPYLPIDTIPMNTLAVSEVRDNAEAQSSLLLFEKGDIVIGAMRVYFHRVIKAPFDGITRTTCFVLRADDKVFQNYGLLCCNQKETIEYAQLTSKGSTMPYAVWEGGLGNYKIIIPPKEVIEKFDGVIDPMFETIMSSYFENRDLKDLRDTLLPKLMSGEIEL